MRASREAEYTEYVHARLGWLRRTAYLLCQDWQGADDLAQKTITRLYTHWGRAGNAASLDAYVRGILVKAFLDERRSAWARRVILPGVYEERPAAGHDADMRLDVRAALRSLPPRQRATVVLRYYCDCPVEEAAEILGVTPGTVKSQTAKGLTALRLALAPRDGGMNPMNTMNEDTVRTLLADVASVPEPPSRISLEAARKTGRRRQRAARLIASGGVAVLVAGGALIVPQLRLAAAPDTATGPASGARIAASAKPAAPVKPAAPAAAPTQFNPLELSANFGWLPSFWNEDGASVEETPTFTVVNLVHGQTLKVSPRGWYPDPALYSSSRGPFPRAATDPKAPAVNGRPAYWDGDGLMWEYAPGAWAYLYGAGNVQSTNGRALNEEMASKVLFGQHQPLYTPFQFTHGLPAGWRATETDSVLTNGRLLVWQLTAGPAAKPGALTIYGDTHAGTCGVQPPPQSTLTTGGILWAYNYSSGPGGDQAVCATKTIDGQYMTMYYYWRGHPQALNLASLLRSTKFFGPDPSGWTTQPIAG